MSNQAIIVTFLLGVAAYFFTSADMFVYFCAFILIVIALAANYVEKRIEGAARNTIRFVFIGAGIILISFGFIHIEEERIKSSASEKVLVTVGEVLAESGRKKPIADRNIFFATLGLEVSKEERELYLLEYRKRESLSAHSRDVLRSIIAQIFETFVSASWWIGVLVTIVIGGALFVVWLMSFVRQE